MFADSPFANPTSSENQPVQPVQVDPFEQPMVPLQINKTYIPYILGAIEQLFLQAAYADDITPDDLNLVQARWMTARAMFAEASIEDVRPFFQDGEEAASDENNSGELWYEPIADWIIT